jgi:penicillin-binding protein 2
MRLAAALSVLAVAAGSAPAAARDFQTEISGLLGRREGAIVVAAPAQGRLLAVANPHLAASAFPPGSAFKLVTALAALDAGQAGPAVRFTCRGSYRPLGPAAPGFSTNCWRPEGHGRLTLEEALGHSCNAAFLGIGERAGLGALLGAARRAGFGAAPGRLPAAGDRASLLPMAIGEGRSLAVTPLQAAAFVSAVAAGSPVRPLAWHPAAIIPGRPVAPVADLARLRAGMRAAVAFGSAKAAASPVVPLAGKTGTSTYLDGTNRTYGWFWGYAPADKPRLVVVVLLKDSSGFQAAAPLARQVAEAWHRAGRP